MGGQFSPYDPLRCPNYAQFAAGFDRPHFDGIYWTMFFLVIFTLFIASWLFQSTMTYKDHPEYREDLFRRKLKRSLICCTGLFLLAAVFLVMEVFALLALQFCDGEDLMSLYWSTWTMLQLGSEIAILGIVLALWHHLCDVRHPQWALALGTPVLVVAGIGHLIHLAMKMCFKRAKAQRESRRLSQSTATDGRDCGKEVTGTISSNTTIKPEVEQVDQRSSDPGLLEAGRAVYLTLDVGDDDRVKRWPSFVGMTDGRAIVQMNVYTDGGMPKGKREI
ncbi:uncharacterized protein GGS25DRAFT_317368 [Hypoxylon fragiforme]|uniref:uncharacterized protein n=1 Tax=Hypoxylon fragiforme TaxID=63214 RepID=UPI0020C71C56|nr:uncharacterized protein GGS25DRAFT_317368 [Hypoxylon fragiforme]KAI2607065.1 hypothetical protein GGS25DRAFT_317368 [Hypoxylon fragiforme]